MGSRLSALLLVLVTGLLPASAWAQSTDTKAPPGLSGADQYLETVPGSDGNRSVGNGQKPNPEDPAVQATVSGVLPSASVAAAKRGGAAADAAALAARTSPGADRSEPRPTGPSGPPAATATPGKPLPGAGGSALATVGRVATGSGGDGMGFLFPLLLVAGTLVVAGSALWRRRGGSTP